MARAPRRDESLLRVRVQPGARRSEVQGWHDTSLRVRVTAPPSGGAANRAVVDLLAAAFRVPASRVELVAGASARDKLFRVAGLSPDQLRARLGGAQR